MRRPTRIALITLAAAGAIAACSDSPTGPTPPTSPPLPAGPAATGLRLDPADSLRLADGAEVRVHASFVGPDGRSAPPPAGATLLWSSSATAVATVDGSGVVRGARSGRATLTAQAGSLRATLPVVVLPVPHEVAPGAAGGEPPFAADTVRVRVLDRHGDPVPDTAVVFEAAHGSVAPARARTDARGVATAHWHRGEGAGVQLLRALVPGMEGRALFLADTVSAERTVRTVRIAPRPDTLAVGAALALTADARDGTGAPVAAAIRWLSLADSVVSIDTGGAVRGERAGTARIVASVGGAADTVVLRVVRVPASVGIGGGRGVEVGDSLALPATVLDGNGEAMPASIHWESLDSAVAGVSGAGVVTPRGAGTARIVAAAGAAADTAVITVVRLPRRIDVAPDPIALAHGDTVAVSTVVRDGAGVPMHGVEIGFALAAAGVATVSADGRLAGTGIGTTSLIVRAGELARVVPVEVTPGRSLFLHALSGPSLVPGQTVTLTGSNFGATPQANTVRIGGVAATVLAASGGELRVRVPERAAFACEPTRPVAIQVSVGGESREVSHPLTVGHRPALAAGEAALVLDGADLDCTELPAGGRYLVTVFNTALNPAQASAFRLSGFEGPAASVGGTSSPFLDAMSPRLPLAPPAVDDPHAHGEGHMAALEESRRLFERLGPPRHPAAGGDPMQMLGANPSALPVGSVVGRRIPLSADGRSFTGCGSATSLNARVVYSGTHIVLLEDTAAPLAGQMDSVYTRLGEEYDAVMLPLLRDHFGSPTAHGAGLGTAGRIQAVFTRLVNGYGPLGFVWGGDLYPVSQCASSNVDETTYINVPLLMSGSGYTLHHWRKHAWGTLMHEAKHIVSFAERLSRGRPWEESWLEEGTAEIAIELWSRHHRGTYRQFGNATYVDEPWSDPSRPDLVRGQVSFLAQYAASVETRSPFGQAVTGGGDHSFYGSAWYLVRYAADHSGRPEAEFFRELVQGSRTGMDNLATQARTSAEVLLGNWTLANFLDDRPGVTVTAPRLTHPSWNTHATLGRFGSVIGARAAGAHFQIDVGALHGGTAAYFESGAVGGSGRVIRLGGHGGSGAAAPTLRIGIARVE